MDADKEASQPAMRSDRPALLQDVVVSDASMADHDRPCCTMERLSCVGRMFGISKARASQVSEVPRANCPIKYDVAIMSVRPDVLR